MIGRTDGTGPAPARPLTVGCNAVGCQADVCQARWNGLVKAQHSTLKYTLRSDLARACVEVTQRWRGLRMEGSAC